MLYVIALVAATTLVVLAIIEAVRDRRHPGGGHRRRANGFSLAALVVALGVMLATTMS